MVYLNEISIDECLSEIVLLIELGERCLTMKPLNLTLSAFTLLAVVSLTPVVYSGEVVISSDGCIGIEALGVRFSPVVHAFNWSTMQRGEADPTTGNDAFTIKINAQNHITGTRMVTPAQDGAVHAEYAFVSHADIAIDSLCVATDIPLHHVRGGTWKSDSASGEYPEENQNHPTLFSGKTKGFIVEGVDPKKFTLAFTFDKPTRVLLQDNRKWGSNQLTFRISPPYETPLKPDVTFAVSFSVKTAEPLTLFRDQPVTLTADDANWIPLKQELDIVTGSALDFSNLIEWHKPAGKLGLVKAVGSHFEFEDLPGVTQRFYGVNLCFSANYITPQQAAKLASRFRKIGYNAVRIHHYDNTLVEGSKDKTTLNPGRINQFDALMAQCIANGIYITTDLFVSRSVPWRSIGVDRSGYVSMDEFKILCAVNAQAMDNWKAFTQAFLSHVNPYTDRSYAAEPALAWLALINEGNLGNFLEQQKNLPDYATKWKEWLTTKKTADPAYADIPDSLPSSLYEGSAHAGAYAQFLSEIESAMAREMKSFIQNDLGCKALITNSNGWTHRIPDQITHHDVYDYVDDHFYIDHPRFLDQPWSLPSQCLNANPFKNETLGMLGCSFNRMAGKPFAISEFNFSAPGRYRGVGGIATGAIAALQDWDVLWRFAYSHNSDSMFTASKIGYFNVSEDPVMMATERAALCLFLRGDVTPLAKSFTVVIPRKEATSRQEHGMPSIISDWRDVAWKAKVQVAIDNAPADSTWSLSFPDAYSAEAQVKARSLVNAEAFGGGAVKVDSTEGTLVLDTPCTAGGFAESGMISTEVMSVEILDAPAAVWISSLDGSPCKTSTHMLLSHITDVQNTGIKYAERSRQTLLDWGRMPHLAERGQALITLRLDDPTVISVYRLSCSGERQDKVETKIVEGVLTFAANTGLIKNDATLFYELIRKD